MDRTPVVYNDGFCEPLLTSSRELFFLALCSFIAATILLTTLTNANCIHKEIKNRLKSGNVCYLSLRSHLMVIFLRP
jgi:hypothetical protein